LRSTRGNQPEARKRRGPPAWLHGRIVKRMKGGSRESRVIPGFRAGGSRRTGREPRRPVISAPFAAMRYDMRPALSKRPNHDDTYPWAPLKERCRMARVVV